MLFMVVIIWLLVRVTPLAEDEPANATVEHFLRTQEGGLWLRDLASSPGKAGKQFHLEACTFLVLVVFLMVVLDGLAKKFPMRVMDFPPEETALLGAAIGYSQVGLIPIVEIPYAKYLDCGADMFFEVRDLLPPKHLLLLLLPRSSRSF